MEIVECLNLKHILTPSQYIFLKNKKTLPNKCTKWNTRLVDSILKNEVYIGSIIQGKRKRVSHKNHSIVRSCEEEWIKTEEHHKPIINSNVFFQVQNIMYNRNVRANSEGKFNTFSGYLKCSDCNCNLHRLKKKKGNIEKVFYYCGTYLKKKQCKKHYITEDELNIIVLKLLNNYIELICNIEDKLHDEIVDSSIEYTNEVKKLKIIKIDKEIDNTQKLLDELKNDYKNNYISDEDFDMFKSKYLYNLNNLKMEKESLNQNIISKVNLEWIKRFKKVGKLETLNKSIIDEFIDNIYVDDDRNIRIEFKFKSNYEEAIMYLKNKENMV